MSQLRINLFGGCTVLLDGEWAGPPLSPLSQALLAYLALYRDRATERRALASLFWPDETEAAADEKLENVVSEIQGALNQRIYDAPPYLLSNKINLTLNPASIITVDVSTFENHLYTVEQHQHRRRDACPQCADRLTRASDLYRGPFLHNLSIPGQPYLDWLTERRDFYRNRAMDIYSTLLSYAHLIDDNKKVVFIAQQMLAVDPWHQNGHIQLLHALAALGETGAAKTHFESLRQQFVTAFQTDLPPAILNAYQAIRPPRPTPGYEDQVISTCSNTPTSPYTGNSWPDLKMDLPVVGREAELVELSDWLSEDKTKCILLAGPGGVGKTHLALTLAEKMRAAFQHGLIYIRLVETQPAKQTQGEPAGWTKIDPAQCAVLYTEDEVLPDKVCEALNLAMDPVQPDDLQANEWFLDREVLLILDNVEYHIPQVKALVSLLSWKAPRATVLMCSRFSLDFPGAVTLELQPFAVPQQTNLVLAADYPCVRLFATCAQRHDPDFALNDDNLPDVVEICRQVEGLPLSIVLAALWIPKFSVRQIADAVESDLSILVASSTQIPERHRNLLAVFESTWCMLSPGEQCLLRQSTVFCGGFDRQAASAILDCDLNIEQILSDLTKNGLLVSHAPDRYDVPRIVRYYVRQDGIADVLTAETAGERSEVTERHAVYYLDPETWQAVSMELEADSQNIRQAWQWAAAYGDLRTYAPGLLAWIRYLEKRGYFYEGSSASETLIWRLKYRDDLYIPPPHIRNMIVELTVARGHFLTMLGKYMEASEVIQDALNLVADIRNTTLMASTQLAWGVLLNCQGDYPAAQTRIARALQYAQEGGDENIIQQCLYHLGTVTMHQSDSSVAQMYLLQSLELSKTHRNLYRQGQVLTALGTLTHSLGDFPEAECMLRDALLCFEESGCMWGMGAAQQGLGFVAHRLGTYTEALRWYEQALHTHHACANLAAEMKTLLYLGLLYSHRSESETAHQTCRQAYDLARQLGDQASEAEVLTIWGHIYAAQHAIIEAAAAYQKALDLWDELGQREGSTEAIAGLVRLALMEGAGIHAMPFVEKILDRIRHTAYLRGAIEPLWIYLTCYQALDENGDLRAAQVIDSAYQLLMAQADKLKDPAQRTSFLTAVAVHRDIIRFYKQK
ncbi:MAG: BTAD domain-containing putative transcriptional regulator [Anaerolineae bacterium]|nr:BTAD domain-containing putative transcriptional regulator [Anaerolineae bacterium]